MDVEIEARDFFQDRFSEDELRSLLGRSPAENFFSWASPSFKKMGLSRDSLNEDQLIAMMLKEPRFVRRPLIVVNGLLLLPESGNRKIIALLEKHVGI